MPLAKTWIFQGSPQIYDVESAIKSLDQFHWSVRQHKADVKIGDWVYIWVSGPEGGLLGSGIVETEVEETEENELEKQFWVKQPKESVEPRVRIKKHRVFEVPIKRLDLVNEPNLKNLSLLRAPQGTNFAVREKEAETLRQMTSQRPTINEVANRYAGGNVVFQSTQRGAQYSITDVDENGFSVNRLTATEPQRCTFDSYDRAVDQVKSHGGNIDLKDFVSNTVAKKVGVLQGPAIDLALDRRSVIDVSLEADLLKHFCGLLSGLSVDQSSGAPKLYKPVLMACVIEAIGEGDLTENKIDFDFIEPRFIEKLNELGQDGGSQQAGYAFYYLTNDLFWMLSYKNLESRIEPSRISPTSIRELVSFATLKDDYWWLLRKHSHRQACLDALASKWWPGKKERKLKFWWVNQGQTYAEERQEGIIWAPKENKAGRSQHHWENVAKVKAGDIVFHYANGDIKSISIANEAGQSHEKPGALEGSNTWKKEGWLARLDYHDLDQPIPRDEISDGIRKLKNKYSPINQKGTANQGYLFNLDEASTRIIAEQLDLESLPTRIAQPLRDLLNNQWAQFVHWGKRFFETGDIRQGEREYKLQIVSNLANAKQRLESGEEDYLVALKTAFGQPNNLTFHISHSKFLDWANENEPSAKSLLRDLWDPAAKDFDAIESFQTSLPADAVKGAGTRTNIASFLAMVRNPTDLPVYKTEPFDFGCRLTGFESPPKDELEIYSHAISFLDRVIEECGMRGLELPDRLDAQTLVWCVTKYEPPEAWSNEERQAFLEWREGKEVVVVIPSGLNELADRLLLDVKCLQEIERLLESKGQIIFYGPPGTGKTYVAREIARYYTEEDGFEIVQFHPSYTYEDFVEGYRPHLHDGQPGFDIVPGPLRLIADKARKNPETKYVLLIDEINRGNIAKVFGELYFLLEYRDEAISLQYNREEKFSLPENLWLIGTMNTADRSIALLDSALRRRFYFFPFFPDEEPIASLLRRWLEDNKPEHSWLADVVDRVNELLGDRHGAIGPSYFLRDDLDDDWIVTIWKHAILPYLAEQFFGEEDRLRDFQLDVVRKSINQEAQQITDATDSTD